MIALVKEKRLEKRITSEMNQFQRTILFLCYVPERSGVLILRATQIWMTMTLISVKMFFQNLVAKFPEQVSKHTASLSDIFGYAGSGSGSDNGICADCRFGPDIKVYH